MILKGYELITLNVIPSTIDSDPEWKPQTDSVDCIKTNFSKLCKVRDRLSEKYNNEFLLQLVTQATDSKGRYKPVAHKKLSCGDVVLLKEKHQKAQNYPMGIVVEVFSNNLGEVTGVKVRKGSNREIVKRHVTSVIPLLSSENHCNDLQAKPEAEDDPGPERSKRKAAARGAERTRVMLNDSLSD